MYSNSKKERLKIMTLPDYIKSTIYDMNKSIVKYQLIIEHQATGSMTRKEALRIRDELVNCIAILEREYQ